MAAFWDEKRIGPMAEAPAAAAPAPAVPELSAPEPTWFDKTFKGIGDAFQGMLTPKKEEEKAAEPTGDAAAAAPPPAPADASAPAPAPESSSAPVASEPAAEPAADEEAASPSRASYRVSNVRRSIREEAENNKDAAEEFMRRSQVLNDYYADHKDVTVPTEVAEADTNLQLAVEQDKTTSKQDMKRKRSVFGFFGGKKVGGSQVDLATTRAGAFKVPNAAEPSRLPRPATDPDTDKLLDIIREHGRAYVPGERVITFIEIVEHYDGEGDLGATLLKARKRGFVTYDKVGHEAYAGRDDIIGKEYETGATQGRWSVAYDKGAILVEGEDDEVVVMMPEPSAVKPTDANANNLTNKWRQGGLTPFEGQIAPEVDIDPGDNMYVLLQAANPQGVACRLLRAYAMATSHADIIETAVPPLAVAGYRDVKCLGGGICKHDSAAHTVVFTGDGGGGFGRASHETAVEMAKKYFGDRYQVNADPAFPGTPPPTLEEAQAEMDKKKALREVEKQKQEAAKRAKEAEAKKAAEATVTAVKAKGKGEVKILTKEGMVTMKTGSSVDKNAADAWKKRSLALDAYYAANPMGTPMAPPPPPAGVNMNQKKEKKKGFFGFFTPGAGKGQGGFKDGIAPGKLPAPPSSNDMASVLTLVKDNGRSYVEGEIVITYFDLCELYTGKEPLPTLLLNARKQGKIYYERCEMESPQRDALARKSLAVTVSSARRTGGRRAEATAATPPSRALPSPAIDSRGSGSATPVSLPSPLARGAEHCRLEGEGGGGDARCRPRVAAAAWLRRRRGHHHARRRGRFGGQQVAQARRHEAGQGYGRAAGRLRLWRSDGERLRRASGACASPHSRASLACIHRRPSLSRDTLLIAGELR